MRLRSTAALAPSMSTTDALFCTTASKKPNSINVASRYCTATRPMRSTCSDKSCSTSGFIVPLLISSSASPLQCSDGAVDVSASYVGVKMLQRSLSAMRCAVWQDDG